MEPILQASIPYDALAEKSLPGISPLQMAEWLIVDDAYNGQMALRRHLLEAQRGEVAALDPGALPAAQEALALVLSELCHIEGFSVLADHVICPDGAKINLDWTAPLITLGQIIQEDICLLQKQGAEHVLTGAVLCFPASWTLSEKFMRPLLRIHVPVSEYDANIAKRVQRLFDGVRPGRPLWRKNALWYDDPELFTPRAEDAPRAPVVAESGAYLRSEKQSILRLPETDAVIFSIHTFMVTKDAVLK
ncbi:heme-dependent oxidative N-demethylase family protein [Shimia marina]|uniref:DUF3445 domain-containing protein n=1 Tax=Shimia marina TaxID=321267 RepID=A0A0N7LSJ8_9RHOB|nr:DUF3445 domain-containing protein [Shimia marina]CUH53820.1 hypothetical protein SHM7688_03282 [Shimia marina]SFE76607.1 Protein of unknown function [Shimia marina]